MLSSKGGEVLLRKDFMKMWKIKYLLKIQSTTSSPQGEGEGG
jgi:hypothetical protein